MDPGRALTAEVLATVRNNFPLATKGVPDGIVQEAVRALPEGFDSGKLRRAIEHLLDQQAVSDMKLELHGSSHAQVRHMLALAGLPAWRWRLISGLVVIPNTPEFNDRTKRMASACKYYNGK